MAKKRPDQNVLCTWYSALNAAHFLTLDHEYTPFYCNSPLLSPQLLFTKPMSNNSHGTPPISPPPQLGCTSTNSKKGVCLGRLGIAQMGVPHGGVPWRVAEEDQGVAGQEALGNHSHIFSTRHANLQYVPTPCIYRGFLSIWSICYMLK